MACAYRLAEAFVCTPPSLRFQPAKPRCRAVTTKWQPIMRALSKSEDAYIFQPSPFRHHRSFIHNASYSTNTTSPTERKASSKTRTKKRSKSLCKSTSTMTDARFDDHASLIKFLHALDNDPSCVPGCSPIVTYRGSPNARLMVIGDMPSEVADPFGQRAGHLLDSIFTFAGFDVDTQLYVTNVVKRRTEDERPPKRAHISFFMPLLKEEVRLIQPSIIVLAGAVAARAFLTGFHTNGQRKQNLKGNSGRITLSAVRGCWFQIQGVWMMPVFHTAQLLRKQSLKKEMMDDINAIRHKYMQLYPDDPLIPRFSRQRPMSPQN